MSPPSQNGLLNIKKGIGLNQRTTDNEAVVGQCHVRVASLYQGVGAVAAQDKVFAGITTDRIVSTSTFEGIRQFITHQDVVELGSDDPVHALYGGE